MSEMTEQGASEQEINLERCTKGGRIHNLAGKNWGESVRKAFGVDRLDQLPGPIPVIVPEHVYAISPSFFLGLFSRSLRSLGGREPFLAHYPFVCTREIMVQIEEGIEDWILRTKANHFDVSGGAKKLASA